MHQWEVNGEFTYNPQIGFPPWVEFSCECGARARPEWTDVLPGVNAQVLKIIEGEPQCTRQPPSS